MFQILPLPLRNRLSKRQTLLAIRTIIENELFWLLGNSCSYDWDLFRKIEEMWTYFDLEYEPNLPDWSRFERPNECDIEDLGAAIRALDFDRTQALVSELAQKTGVIS
jgi:hypothetical protein